MAGPWYLRVASSCATMPRELLGRPLQSSLTTTWSNSFGLLELLARELEPLLDLAGALGRPLAQPPLELGDVGAATKIVDRAGTRRCTRSAPSVSSSSTRTLPSAAIRSISDASVP